VAGVLLIGGPYLISKLLQQFFPQELQELANEELVPANPDPALVAPLPNQPPEFPFNAVALYDHLPQHPDDLEFRKGDLLRVTAPVGPGWYEGALGARRGVFPAQWVSPVAPTPESTASL
jgi:hypothetical protein